MAFSFVSALGGKLQPNTNYTINEQDILAGAGANLATSYLTGTLQEVKYGLHPVTFTLIGGVQGTRTYNINVGTENYGEWTKIRFSYFDGDRGFERNTPFWSEQSVDNSTLPPNPNRNSPRLISPPFNINSYLGAVTINSNYFVSEQDMLAPYTDDDGDVLAVAEYGDPTTIGLPRLDGKNTVTVFSGTAPNRIFEIGIGTVTGNFVFDYTVTDQLSNYADNAYCTRNGKQRLQVRQDTFSTVRLLFSSLDLCYNSQVPARETGAFFCPH